MDIWLFGAVVAAFVVGVSAIVISLVNSRRLTKLEQQREQSRLEKGRLESVRDTYEQFCDIGSPSDALNNFREKNDWRAFMAVMIECNAAISRYADLIQRVMPYLDSDLYRRCNKAIEAHDTALRTFLEASEVSETLENNTHSLIRAVGNTEETCKEALSEQIGRLLGNDVTSSI